MVEEKKREAQRHKGTEGQSEESLKRGTEVKSEESLKRCAKGEGMKSYRDLIVWQKSMSIVTQIYKVTKEFPKEEIYGLTQQIRRCCISVPSNIAEGYGRRSTDDYARFLQIAISSLFETQTQIEIALNLKYLSENDFNKVYELSREIERMLSSLIKKIKRE